MGDVALLRTQLCCFSFSLALESLDRTHAERPCLFRLCVGINGVCLAQGRRRDGKPQEGIILMSDHMPVLGLETLTSLDLRIQAVQRIAAGQWWNFRRVISPFSRLWLILDGRATVRQEGQRFDLRSGILHLVPAFTEHDCFCRRYFDHYHLHFTARLPAGIDLFSLIRCDAQLPAPRQALAWFQRLDAIYPDRKLPCFDPFREEYQEFPARMEQTRRDAPPAQWLEAQGLLRLLVAPYLASASGLEGVHARVTQRFLAVQVYIHEHMHEPIALSHLAHVAGLNPTYFSDRFNELVGVRPLAYLARRRMERAQYLLATTPAAVKEIAYAVGLPDPAHFSRMFSRLCGHSPSEYRDTHGSRPSA